MKKYLISLLVGALLIVPYSSSLATSDKDIFSDLDSDDPSIPAIEYLAENGVVQGYDDDSFQSLNKINRAEFLKIIVAAVTDDAEGENCFPDVGTEWFAKYVCYAKDKGWISGYPDGTFQPANEINFAEASKVVANAFGIEGSDLSSDDPWYREFVEPIGELGAIPTSISDLDKSIARGEMAEVVYRIDDEQTDLDSLAYEELEGMPIQIESCDALKERFLSDPYTYYYDDIEYAEEEVAAESGDVGGMGGGGGGDPDYSETNVQVEGVDEADIVKNDGGYIYLINDYTVRIVDAYPADEMEEIAIIEFEDLSFRPSELYVDGDQLIVIGYTYNYDVYDYGFEDIYFPYYHENKTSVYIFDIEDRDDPQLFRQIEVDGNLNSSRKVDDTLYLILNKYDFSYYYYDFDPDDINVEEVLPLYYDSGTGEEGPLVDCTDIKYFPREDDLNYLITMAIPLDNDDSKLDSEVLIGSSHNIYSSRDNLYVAATNYDSYYDYYYDWNNAKTLVYQFELDPGSIEYKSRGKVPGTILNQFSMDESSDHFRIATTKGHVWDGNSTNNVYILNNDMEIVGSIEDLAPGETIYSTRFMGDRGYMVTFKKVDPLFVFDLSDPENPEVLGELKIPGFSDYLHPVGENYLLGFGKDAADPTEEQEAARDLDFAWYQGMKVALFDVTDPTNPEQKFSVGIGDRGTYSDLLWNHKALLFDEAKELLAFPVSVYELEDEDVPPETYGEMVFQGAYVYNFTTDDGFDLRGTVSHYDEEFDPGDYWYNYNYDKEITRVLYIGNTLYTVSTGYVKASEMDTLDEIDMLELWGPEYGGDY